MINFPMNNDPITSNKGRVELWSTGKQKKSLILVSLTLFRESVNSPRYTSENLSLMIYRSQFNNV